MLCSDSKTRMDLQLASVEQIAQHQGNALIIDLRGKEELEKLGNRVNDSINIPYVSDNAFEEGVMTKLTENKDQIIICY